VTISQKVKRLGPEAHYSLASNAKVKNGWRYTSTPPHVFMAWSLIKQRYYFTFIILRSDIVDYNWIYEQKFLILCIAALILLVTSANRRSVLTINER
jgi:hypothetical protein